AISAIQRIDVHHHFVPPALIQAIGAQRLGAASANWTPARALEEMERGGVSTAINSIAPAGDPFNDPSTAVRLCRESNEYSTRLAADYPRRFGGGTDTTRAIAQIIFGGAASRYPNVRMIFSHGGGTIPSLVELFSF